VFGSIPAYCTNNRKQLVERQVVFFCLKITQHIENNSKNTFFDGTLWYNRPSIFGEIRK